MTLVQTMPIIAAIIFVTIAVSALLKSGRPSASLWIIPAILGTVFAAWSIGAVIMEGPTGFWPEHTRNLWGNQIWFDLLLAVGIGWVLILPRARAVNMKLPLWLIFIILTGCIGFSAMLSRLFYLETRDTA